MVTENNKPVEVYDAVEMRFDMRGRLNKINFVTNPLLPVFEAIINSIHSIEDGKEHSGKITIRIIRNTHSLFYNRSRKSKREKTELSPIVGFEVEDNGIGFTQDNFKHFLTTDTTHKIKRGGRGVGRLSWLKAFDDILVDSSFLNKASERECRAFAFNLKGNTDSFVFNRQSGLNKSKSNRTIVKMDGFHKEYQEKCPKKADTIASRIIGHFVDYFLSEDCPQICLVDNEASESIVLNDYFKNSILSRVTSTKIQIGEFNFNIKHLRLTANFGDGHTLFYSANRRTVKSDDLAKLIPNLSSKLWDDGNGEEKFVYFAYVESPFFDNNVNEDRNDFSIALDDNMFGELNWQQIKSKIIEECRAHIAPYTLHVEQKKRERIDKFVSEQAPQYRSILKYAEKEMASVSPDIDDDKLDLELYGVYQSVQKQVRTEGIEILNEQQASSNDSIDDYEKKIKTYLEKITDINKSDLARYVCQRKVVLDYLQNCLLRRQDGKYNYESDIHNTIFPMIASSEDIPFQNHNLWVLDEKLVYHTFLASDQPISSYMESESTKEPDLAIFNAYDKACAFSNSPEGEIMTSIIIVEFKRPMRDAYSKEENPIDQVYSYIEEIREGKKLTRLDRPFIVAPQAPFYCYIVCDIRPKIQKWALNSGFMIMPDGQGYYCYNPGRNAYVEIISFDKMLSDAKKRQMAFFNELNLPSYTSPVAKK